MGLNQWIFSKIDRIASSAHEKEIKDFLIRLKGMDADEIANVVVITTCMKHRLIRENVLPAYCLGIFIETNQTKSDLCTAITNIGNIIRHNQSSGNLVACAGMFPWRHSVGCILRQELRYYGKEMWKELSRGFDQAMDVCVNSIAVPPIVKKEIISLEDPEKELTSIPEMLNPFKN